MPFWKPLPEKPDPLPTSRRAGKQTAPAPQKAELYLRWAQVTQWRGFCRGVGIERTGSEDTDDNKNWASAGFDILVIARADAALRDRLQSGARLQITKLYEGDGPSGASYFTATLKRADLDVLMQEPELEWELSMPLHPPRPTAQATTVGRYGPSREEEALAGAAVLGSRAALIGARADPAVAEEGAVAIIDFGCPFLRYSLAGPSGRGVRVIALWDQGSRPLKPLGKDPDRREWWDAPRHELYGRELNRKAMNNIAGQMLEDPTLTEEAIYRSIDYLVSYEDPRRRIWGSTHGSSVMDLAAGTEDPVDALVAAGADAGPAGATDAQGGGVTDHAASADIVFVQLPALTAADSSGGSLAAHLLDGVRYAMAVCPSSPLAVNISYGSFAGPHDGSSLLERAFDELLERRSNLQIVVAAGNARAARCHAARTVRPDKPALFRFVLTPDDTTDTFVELWYPRRSRQQASSEKTSQGGDDAAGALKLRVRSSGRAWSDWIPPGGAIALYDDATRQLLALVQHEVRVMHGQGAMALVALAPTATALNDVGPTNDPGLWEIEVAIDGAGEEAIDIDAWIERDDPADNSTLGEQPHFCGLDLDDDRDTLSSIATGRRTIVVGGYRWSDGQAVPYSSLPREPPTLEAPSLLMAPCELDGWQPTLRAAAVVGNSTFRLSGTSIAAPIVTRRLFNLMVENKDAPLGRAELINALTKKHAPQVVRIAAS